MSVFGDCLLSSETIVNTQRGRIPNMRRHIKRVYYFQSLSSNQRLLLPKDDYNIVFITELLDPKVSVCESPQVLEIRDDFDFVFDSHVGLVQVEQDVLPREVSCVLIHVHYVEIRIVLFLNGVYVLLDILFGDTRSLRENANRIFFFLFSNSVFFVSIVIF